MAFTMCRRQASTFSFLLTTGALDLTNLMARKCSRTMRRATRTIWSGSTAVTTNMKANRAAMDEGDTAVGATEATTENESENENEAHNASAVGENGVRTRKAPRNAGGDVGEIKRAEEGMTREAENIRRRRRSESGVQARASAGAGGVADLRNEVDGTGVVHEVGETPSE